MPTIMPRLIAEIFQHTNYRGRVGYICEPVRFTGDIGFQDNISSVRIYKGPQFNLSPNMKVVFCQDINFQGKQLILGPGFYPDLHDIAYTFGDRVSSINFKPGLDVAGPEWGTIPAIVDVYQHADFKGLMASIIRDVPYTGELGLPNDTISSVRVVKGPDCPLEGIDVIFYEHRDFEGAELRINLKPQEYKVELTNLHILPQSFGDMISSIKIEGWSSSSQFAETVFEDEFNGSIMRPEWVWEDPRGGGSWQERQGFLEMRANPGQDLWWGNPPGRGGNMHAPRVLMEISGDFAIETRMRISSSLREHGGLLVWRSPESFLRLEKTCGAHGFRGDVRFEQHVNRVFRLIGRRGWRRIRELYLRIERTGNLFSGYAAIDPARWASVGQAYIGMGDTVQIGLHALAPGNVPPTITRFDYFRVQKRKQEASLYKPVIMEEPRYVDTLERMRAARELM